VCLPLELNEGVNIFPRVKVHPWCQVHPLWANFTPGGKLMLIKNRPQDKWLFTPKEFIESSNETSQRCTSYLNDYKWLNKECSGHGLPKVRFQARGWCVLESGRNGASLTRRPSLTRGQRCDYSLSSVHWLHLLHKYILTLCTHWIAMQNSIV
jgi:hypothetical protein